MILRPIRLVLLRSGNFHRLSRFLNGPVAEYDDFVVVNLYY